MKRYLPPLNPLKAFEAAARLSSMSLAAAELNVTQAAISKQVKTLELFLRRKLFLRLAREIRLTESGERYFRAITRSFDDLDAATRELGHSDSRKVVRFNGYYGFNMHWLLPKLTDFRASHPEIEIHLATSSTEEVDFSRNAVDCAVRTGKGEWKNCDFEFIAPVEFSPVCGPRTQKMSPLRDPSDLSQCTLISSVGSPSMWGKWLELVGECDVDPTSGLELDNAALCYQAAMQDLGVAIADRLLVSDHIKAERLFHPFTEVYRDPRSYYFLTKRCHESSGLAVFRAWLTSRLKTNYADISVA